VISIHSNQDKTKAGTRFYIHARNVAKAVHFLLDTTEKLDKIDASKGQFNIVGEKEIDNLELAKFIAKTIGKELKYEMVDFHSSRPGHDLRYSLSGEKLKNMGFIFPKTLEESLVKTIQWSLENKKWIYAVQ
jgi:dTDP-glucose 4,6-dehydratase